MAYRAVPAFSAPRPILMRLFSDDNMMSSRYYQAARLPRVASRIQKRQQEQARPPAYYYALAAIFILPRKIMPHSSERHAQVRFRHHAGSTPRELIFTPTTPSA